MPRNGQDLVVCRSVWGLSGAAVRTGSPRLVVFDPCFPSLIQIQIPYGLPQPSCPQDHALQAPAGGEVFLGSLRGPEEVLLDVVVSGGMFASSIVSAGRGRFEWPRDGLCSLR